MDTRKGESDMGGGGDIRVISTRIEFRDCPEGELDVGCVVSLS